ncbi:serine carboxypeptidase II-2 [Tanacetum coccineum]
MERVGKKFILCPFSNGVVGGYWQDSPISVLDVYQELIASGLRIWIFSGDTDAVIPVTSTRYSIDALNLTTISPWRAGTKMARQLREFLGRFVSFYGGSEDWCVIAMMDGGRDDVHADPITEQQKQDQVFDLPGQNFNVDFAQYAGYVTVNEENGRALFYWLTEATQDPASKPLVLWLNGGPGCSSIAYGMSEEVGPFHVDKDGKSVLLEPLFLEHRSRDLHCVAAEDLLQFVLNWLERFPQYKGRDFYMKGESYAGHYVPQLSQVGNAVTDEYHDHLGLFQFWWTVGLISDQTYKKLNDVCDKAFYYRPSQECVQIRENLLQEVGNIDSVIALFTPFAQHYGCQLLDAEKDWHVSISLLKAPKLNAKFVYI